MLARLRRIGGEIQALAYETTEGIHDHVFIPFDEGDPAEAFLLPDHRALVISNRSELALFDLAKNRRIGHAVRQGFQGQIFILPDNERFLIISHSGIEFWRLSPLEKTYFFNGIDFRGTRPALIELPDLSHQSEMESEKWLPLIRSKQLAFLRPAKALSLLDDGRVAVSYRHSGGTYDTARKVRNDPRHEYGLYFIDPDSREVSSAEIHIPEKELDKNLFLAVSPCGRHAVRLDWTRLPHRCVPRPATGGFGRRVARHAHPDDHADGIDRFGLGLEIWSLAEGHPRLQQRVTARMFEHASCPPVNHGADPADLDALKTLSRYCEDAFAGEPGFA